jgi:hypothetical protein
MVDSFYACKAGMKPEGTGFPSTSLARIMQAVENRDKR